MKNTTIPISFRIPEEMLERLKQFAREESAEQKRDIHYVDLIRESIEKTYPKKRVRK